MIEKSLKLSMNLEARYAALFVQKASKFSSKVQIKFLNKMVNAKSIMGIISLGGVIEGALITLITDGPDEEQACEELSAFLLGDPEQM